MFQESANMHPTAHMSIALVYVSHPNNNSGALYHNVTTFGV